MEESSNQSAQNSQRNGFHEENKLNDGNRNTKWPFSDNQSVQLEEQFMQKKYINMNYGTLGLESSVNDGNQWLERSVNDGDPGLESDVQSIIQVTQNKVKRELKQDQKNKRRRELYALKKGDKNKQIKKLKNSSSRICTMLCKSMEKDESQCHKVSNYFFSSIQQQEEYKSTLNQKNSGEVGQKNLSLAYYDNVSRDKLLFLCQNKEFVLSLIEFAFKNDGAKRNLQLSKTQNKNRKKVLNAVLWLKKSIIKMWR